jgi:dynein heavy chain
METALEFLKLEKIELGGIKGKLLSQQVVKLFEEFKQVFLHKISYKNFFF